jgi:hypothetical protein
MLMGLENCHLLPEGTIGAKGLKKGFITTSSQQL